MPKEIDLEQRCRQYTEKLGGRLIKLKTPGNRGIHDRLLILPRYVAFIEFKHPNKRGRLSDLQIKWQDFFDRMGMRAYKVESFEFFVHICNKRMSLDEKRLM